MSLTVLEGNTFFVCDDDGNASHGSEGLYANDVRYVSLWRMTLDGLPPTLLGTGAQGHYRAASYGYKAAYTGRGAPEIATLRRFFVSVGTFQEELEVANNSHEAVTVRVRYEFDCDFLDLFEVKSREFGQRDLAFARTITPLPTERRYDDDENSYAFAVSGSRFRASALIWFSERGVPGDREIEYEIELGPRENWRLRAHLVLLAGAERAARYSHAHFGAERRRVEESVRTWHDSTPVMETPSTELGATYDQTLADLAALRMRVNGGGELPAAGLPWFATVFGRDTAIVGLQTLALGQGLAREALLALAEHQSEVDDPEKDAEPGKILHELRFGKVAALSSSFPYYGSVDSTPLFLMLLGETFRWTGDAAFARSLEPAARRALAWIEGPGDPDGDGYLEFHRRSKRGLEVQCWKDSWNSMLFRDGTIARSPLAVCEVQGYAYAARLALAEVARAAWGDDVLADRLERDAAALREAFDRDFWIDRDGGYYALALDAGKRQVDSLTSNVGHLLWTGIAKPERVHATARALMSDEMFSGWGVRTMSAREGGYNPIEYHDGTVWPHDTSIACAGLAQHGFRDEATVLHHGLLEAAQHFGWRLPEVIAGYPRGDTSFPVPYPTACSPQAWAAAAPVLTLQAVLGLRPDPATRTLRVQPEAPPGPFDLRLSGIPACGPVWDVEVADGRARVAPQHG
jgi:glycogen debranching enzyme